MSEGKEVRIATAIKKVANMNTCEAQMRGFDPENPQTHPCTFLENGQTCFGGSQAQEYCHPWAWADIHGKVRTVAFGGGFPWVNTPKAAISWYTDRMKPAMSKVKCTEVSDSRWNGLELSSDRFTAMERCLLEGFADGCVPDRLRHLWGPSPKFEDDQGFDDAGSSQEGLRDRAFASILGDLTAIVCNGSAG